MPHSATNYSPPGVLQSQSSPLASKLELHRQMTLSEHCISSVIFCCIRAGADLARWLSDRPCEDVPCHMHARGRYSQARTPACACAACLWAESAALQLSQRLCQRRS